MPNPPISFPARFTPVNAIAYVDSTGGTEPVTPATPLPVTLGSGTDNLEAGGLPITGTVMPSGGLGLTGWLSAIYRSCINALPAGTNHIGNVFVDDVPDALTISGSATSAATVVSSSTAGFSGGSFQVVSSGSACTITYEQSNDGVTWSNLPVIIAQTPTTVPAATSTSTGMYAFITCAANVRARVSTYGSGTVSVALTLKRRTINASAGSLTASSAAIGSVTVSGVVNTNSAYTDSTTALAAAGTFTGTGRPSTLSQYSFFTATAFADTAGTLFIDQSLDTGATYQPIASVAVPANTGQQLTARVTGSYSSATLYRVRYVNGATAQGTFRISSASSAR
ncbi:hypothetical protein GGQ88_002062 [Novosphingobium hassiacum]|uniref:Uncharacterized protein n=1 Tax=Novosphingobium hassiacum TaxID=173676 RepID=A0A7W6EVZ0_9SPHN|nr:hypothetical protein [Novosphingobium hassiacum]MBB3860793.1 hypothetical protein [Novosphingobium hassiacum]